MEQILNYSLLNLIDKYNKKGKLADEAFVKHACNCFLKFTICEKLFSQLDFKDTPTTIDERFDYASKRMVITLPPKNEKLNIWDISDADKVAAYNLEVLREVYEAFGLMRQYQKWQNNEHIYPYIKDVIRATTNPNDAMDQEFSKIISSKDYYFINPLTRMSIVKSAMSIRNYSYQTIFDDQSFAHDYYSYIYLSLCKQGYIQEGSRIISPLESFVIKKREIYGSGKRESNSFLYNSSEVFDANKIYYFGLPVSPEALETLVKDAEATKGRLLSRKKDQN